jgi:molybdopterin synthase catalytic subunit
MKTLVTIVNGALPPAAESRQIPQAGALLCFEGYVRPLEGDKPIDGLHYQVYEPMASQELEKLGGEAMSRFELLSLLVQHSRGDVRVGECSFRLQIASKHRKEGLAAMDWFIDRMKQDIPIWKQPISPATPQ